MKKILVLLLLLSQCYLFANPINKDFLRYNWTENPKDFFLKSSVDSTAYPHSLLVETMGEKKGAMGYIFPTFHINKTVSKIEVKVKYKTEDCKELYLIVGSIGEGERINLIDTLQLPLNKGWTVSTQSAIVDNPLLLNLTIVASGVKQKKGKIWMSDLDIFIDGKNIDELSTNSHETNVILKKEDVIRLENNNFKDLPFSEKKILAIGETVHGSSTMNDFAVEMIKNRIVNNNCRIVLLEIPLESSFYINRYIAGDQYFELDTISTYFNDKLYSDSFISLIRWIKEYNLSSKEKVLFLGLDMNSVPLKSRVDLFNFFYALNAEFNNNELNTICKLLLETKTPLKNVLSIFDANHDFENIFNKKESELIRYSIEAIDQTSDSYYRFISRDSTMYENAKFVINNLLDANQSITIFEHFRHVNYNPELTILDHYPFGYYMRNKYKSDYSCIALAADSGSILSSNLKGSNFKVEKLEPAPSGSIESLINKLNIDSCYLSMEGLTCSDVLKMRYIGNRMREDEFGFIIPKSRMDGVIFIKKVAEIHKRNNILKMNLNQSGLIMNSYIQALLKMKMIKKW